MASGDHSGSTGWSWIGCDHQWVPSDPMIEWRCVRCDERRDGMPKDGPSLMTRLVRVVARAVFGTSRMSR